MPFKYLPSPVFLVLLIATSMAPSLGFAQPHIVSNDTSHSPFNRESHGLNNGNVDFEFLYERQEFRTNAMEFIIEQDTFADRVLLDRKTSYTLTPRVYAFSTKRHDQDGLSGSEYSDTVSAGVGWHALNDGSNRLDVDIGVGKSTVTMQQYDEPVEDAIGRLSLQFTSRLTENVQFRQNLTIESSSTRTSSESKTTFSVALKPKLALQLLHTAKKYSNLPPDILSVDRHTMVGLTYAF